MSITDVLAEYDRIRLQNEAEQIRRRKQVYNKAPEIKEIHDHIKALQLEKIKRTLTGDTIDTNDITLLQKKAGRLLVEAGFDKSYLGPVFACPVCRDAGVLDNGQRCDCFKKRVLEDKLNTARLTDSDVSFELFDVNVFDDTPIDNGKSQKDMMRKIKTACEKYADTLPQSPPLFLLSGATGLGKTYISKCMMRRVIEHGFTAAYYTAYRLFSLFHRDRLGESIDLDPLFEVPLLIIDDIGTEPMTRNVTKEYFFDLINERIANRLHTIIATNLPFHIIKERYGDRIHSRLMDKRHSKKILFKGKDIRY